MATIILGLFSHAGRMILFRHPCQNFPKKYGPIHAFLLVVALVLSVLRHSVLGDFTLHQTIFAFAINNAILFFLLPPEFFIIFPFANIGIAVVGCILNFTHPDLNSNIILSLWETTAALFGCYRVLTSSPT